MSEPVKISVCIAVYKVELYIEQCVRTLFEQTMQEGIEFIFVNDCTPDRSIEILKQVLEEYPHRKPWVKIIDHPENCGVGKARRTAVENASGAYIIHCDPDDWVELDMYETMYNEAVKNDADMVYCDFAKVDGAGNTKLVPSGYGTTADEVICELFSCLYFGGPTVRMYRRAKTLLTAELEDRIEKFNYCEDLLRNVFSLRNCQKVCKIDRALYWYRRNPNSICSARTINSRRDAFKLTVLFDEYFTEEKYQKSLDCRRRWALYSVISSRIITAGEWHALWKRAKRGMWKDPFWNIFQKGIFYMACINFTLTSWLFRKLKGIKE